MSLAKIVDSFKEGRKYSKQVFDEYDSTINTEEKNIFSYSNVELASYGVGFFCRPKVVYEIAKFFISGQYLGGQGISKEEIEEDLREYKKIE